MIIIIFLYTYSVRKKYWILEIFHFEFLVYLHILGCLEQDCTLSENYLSVCEKKFVAIVTQQLLNRSA